MSESENVGGRPSSYRAVFATQGYKLCLLGATDKEMADFFEVSEATINNWKLAHPRFLESLKKGKSVADGKVADALYRRALGYKHKAVKIVTVACGNNQGSDVQEVPYIEHYAPDTVACIFWLKNRRPDQWRDKREVEVDPKSIGETARAIREALATIDNDPANARC